MGLALAKGAPMTMPAYLGLITVLQLEARSCMTLTKLGASLGQIKRSPNLSMVSARSSLMTAAQVVRKMELTASLTWMWDLKSRSLTVSYMVSRLSALHK